MMVLKDFAGEKSVSAIRKITKDLDFLYSFCDLTDVDNMLLSESGSLERRLEILNVRALIQECKPELKITYKQRKPIVEPGFISISHSDSLAAFIWHPDKEVAIDIEEISDRVSRIAKRAFSDFELSFANNDLLKLNLLWNVKECVYKLAGIKGLDYKAQISVLPFNANESINAVLYSKDSSRKFIFNYSTILEHSFVWGNEEL